MVFDDNITNINPIKPKIILRVKTASKKHIIANNISNMVNSSAEGSIFISIGPNCIPSQPTVIFFGGFSQSKPTNSPFKPLKFFSNSLPKNAKDSFNK